MSEKTAQAVVPFVHQLAGQALYDCLLARLRGNDVAESFLEGRDRYVQSQRRLQASVPPPDALFWSTD